MGTPQLVFSIVVVAPVTWSADWAWGLPLIVLTVVIHVFGLGLIGMKASRISNRALERRHPTAAFVMVLGATTLLATCLHALEAGMWAEAYRLLNALPDAKSAMLYSLNATTSYGHSSLMLEDHWQLMGAMESLNGWLLFGLTTAFLFGMVEKAWSSGRGVRAPLERLLRVHFMRELTLRRNARRFPMTKNLLVFITCSLSFLETGCLHPKIGPQSLPRDRAAYTSGLADSWKEQTLLNIVKLRYIDAPAFVDISSITTGYSLTQTASVGAQVNTPAATTQENVGVAAALGYTPTITYSPLTGSAFIQGLLTPLPPTLVFGAIQNGVPADLILLSVVISINGVKNQQTTLNGITPSDPDFERVRALLRKIQISGGVRTYVKPNPNGPATIVALRKADIAPEIVEDIRELRGLLKLNPDAEEFTIVQAPVSSSDTEIAMMTRSVISVMQNMAADVEVPAEDLAKTRAFPGYEKDQGASDTRMIRIHSSKQKSPNAFVSVNYRNTWFWIDDSDLRSKQVFLQLMNLFSMADTAPRAAAPVVTIPAR